MGVWRLQEISICFHLFCTYSSNFHHYVYSSYTDHIFFWFIKSLNCPQAPKLCLWDKKYKIIVTKFKKIGSDIPLKLQNKSFWMLIFVLFLIFPVSDNLIWCIYLLWNDHINIVLTITCVMASLKEYNGLMKRNIRNRHWNTEIFKKS